MLTLTALIFSFLPFPNSTPIFHSYFPSSLPSLALSQRLDVLQGACGDNITALGQSLSQDLLDVNRTLVEAVTDLVNRAHAHSLALEQASERYKYICYSLTLTLSLVTYPSMTNIIVSPFNPCLVAGERSE